MQTNSTKTRYKLSHTGTGISTSSAGKLALTCRSRESHLHIYTNAK